MTLRAARLASLVLSVAMAGCGGWPSQPTESSGGANSGGSGVTCRNYAATSTVTVQSNGLSSSSPATCSWDANLHQLTCTVSASGGGQVCATTVSTYNSLADFVDEIRVIPPALLRTSDVQTSDASPVCGTGNFQNISYVYDSQRRVTQVVNGPSTTTYSAWDSSGRPTQGTLPVGTPVTIAYDAGARTQTQTTGSGTGAVVVTTTFDTDGTPAKVVTVNAGITTTVTTQVNSTGRVCK
jgi:YD repeat-containing protein